MLHRVAARRRAPRGFSLLELLIAVGIVVVLVALAIPVGSSIAASTTAARCVSHLRENGALLHASASDRGGAVPVFFYDLPGSSRTWADYLVDGSYIARNSPTQVCPAVAPKVYTARGNIYGVALPTVAQVEEAQHYARVQGLLTIRLSAIDEPSQCWLLTDSWIQSQEKQFYVISDGQGGVHFRHRNKANFLFADGHVRALTTAEVRELKHHPLRKGYDIHGHLSSF